MGLHGSRRCGLCGATQHTPRNNLPLQQSASRNEWAGPCKSNPLTSHIKTNRACCQDQRGPML
jgi:hypothetical protein